MARQIVSEVDYLMARVRQTGGTAINEDLATEILTTCQQVINIALKKVVSSTPFSTTSGQLLYSIRTDIGSDAVELVSVDQSGRELLKAPRLLDLAAYDINFYSTSSGTRLEAWCSIGRDYFILYPGCSSSQTVNLNYVKATTIYTDYSALTGSDYMELPDEAVELAQKLSECILLMRSRDYTLIEHHIDSFLDLFKAKYGEITG